MGLGGQAGAGAGTAGQLGGSGEAAAELAGARTGPMHIPHALLLQPQPHPSPLPRCRVLSPPFPTLVRGETGTAVLLSPQRYEFTRGVCKHQARCQSPVIKSLLGLHCAQPHQSPSPSPRSDPNLPPRWTCALVLPWQRSVQTQPRGALRGVMPGAAIAGASQTREMPTGGDWERPCEGAGAARGRGALHSCTLQARGAIEEQSRERRQRLAGFNVWMATALLAQAHLPHMSSGWDVNI